MDELHLIELFPLELVVLPGESVPLHIFEERYKRLIRRHRNEGGEFGVVQAEEGRVHECGCSVALTAVLEEFEDGRLNIVVEGRRRFRILSLQQPDQPDEECLAADVEFYADDEAEAPGAVRETVLAAFVQLLKMMGVESPQVPHGAGPLSFRLAGAVDFGTDVKQALVESTSEKERLLDLTRVIRALLPRLEAQRKRAEAIRGNGKGA